MSGYRGKLDPNPPPWFRDSDGCGYYVVSHDPEECHCIDGPEHLIIENIWMRPGYPPDPGDFGYEPEENLVRGKDGRFKTPTWWWECAESDPDAVAYMHVTYAPVAARLVSREADA